MISSYAAEARSITSRSAKAPWKATTPGPSVSARTSSASTSSRPSSEVITRRSAAASYTSTFFSTAVAYGKSASSVVRSTSAAKSGSEQSASVKRPGVRVVAGRAVTVSVVSSIDVGERVESDGSRRSPPRTEQKPIKNPSAPGGCARVLEQQHDQLRVAAQSPEKRGAVERRNQRHPYRVREIAQQAGLSEATVDR